MIQVLIDFLSQSGPRAYKHSSSWIHPLSTLILHYIIITVLTIFAHDNFISVPEEHEHPHLPPHLERQQQQQQRQQQIAQFTILYFFTLISYRIAIHAENKMIQKGILYESTWLCNSTLYMATVGLSTQRPILVLSHVVVVSIDQVLWYVDLTGWLLSGCQKFPIGVAKYLTWPETSWATRITCTHHLWTIPLLIYACNGIPYPIQTYILSAFVMVLNVSLSRWLTPSVIEAPIVHKTKNGMTNGTKCKGDSGKDHKCQYEIVKYLNVNLSHEVWKDITFELLQIKHDDPPVLVYLFRLFVRWQLFNGVVFFLVVYPLSNFFFPPVL